MSNEYDGQDEECKKLAKEIIAEFWRSVDQGLGRSVRKKFTYLLLILILAGSIYFGLIQIPGKN